MTAENDQLFGAHREFVAQYGSISPYKEVISFTSPTDRVLFEWLMLGKKKRMSPGNSIQDIRRRIIESGNNPDEKVISIILSDKLPEGFEIPPEFQGVKTVSIVKRNMHPELHQEE